MKIKKFVFNPFGENTYIIWNEQSGDAAIIDPGMSNQYERDSVQKFISENGLKLSWLLNTHMHFDHAVGNQFMEATYNLETACCLDDSYLAEALPQQAAMFGIRFEGKGIRIRKPLEECEIFVAGENCNVLFVPGHTKGHIALYFPDSGIVFTGDVLFQSGIGRTDLPGGDYDKLIKSIDEKLMTLPGSTLVYPGHGPSTTIGYESQTNPYLT